MPEYDGSIVIDSHIDTKNFEKDSSKLFDKMKSVSDQMNEAFDDKKLEIYNARLKHVLKSSQDLGDKILAPDISKNFSTFSDTVKRGQIDIANTKNKMIELADTIRNMHGIYSQSEIETLISSYERLEGHLRIIQNTSTNAKITLSDVKEQTNMVNAYDVALLKVADTLSRFRDFKPTDTVDMSDMSKPLQKLSQDIQESELKLESFIDKLKLLKSKAGDESLINSQDFINESNILNSEIDKISKKIYLLNIQKETLLKYENKNEIAEELNKVDESLNKAKGNTKKLNSEISKIPSKFNDTIKAARNLRDVLSSFPHIGNLFSNAFGGLSNMFERITNRFRWIVLGQTIRAVIADAKQSIMDLRTYSGEFDSSMQSLRDSAKRVGNALTTAFAPILQALAPAIANISMWITELLNKVAIFTTALFTNSKTAVIADTSFSGYAKNADKVAKNVNKGTKALKDQTNTLAKFDKLDVFKQDKLKSPANELQSDVIPQAMKMFKTVAIPNNILEFKNKLSRILDSLGNKFKKLANEFNKGFNLGFKDNNLDVLKKKLENIGKIMNEIFSDDNVVSKFNETILRLSFNTGKIIGAFASVGVSLGKMIIGGFENFLDGNKDRIKQSLIRNFDTTIDFSNLLGDVAEFVANVAMLFGEDKAQSIFGNFLSIAYNIFDTNFSNIYKIVEKSAETMFYPFINNADEIKEALEGAFSAMQSVTNGANEAVKGFADGVTDVVDNSIVPALNSLKDVWQDRFGVIISVWNKSLKPTLEDIGNKTEEIGAKIGKAFGKLAGPINSVFGLIVDVYNKIKPFLENYFYPLFEKYYTLIGQNIGEAFTHAFGIISTIIGNAVVRLGYLADGVSNAINTIRDIINGNWSQAWEDAKLSFKGFISFMLNGFKLIPDLLVETINSIIRSINIALSAIGNIGFGGFKLSTPRLPEIPKIPTNFGIPFLSSGAVVSPNRRFLAMLGDNTNEQEIVSPVSTMKQAFMEAFTESGMSGNNGNIVLQLDGTTFARLINPYNQAEQTRIGVSMVEGVSY